MMGSIDYISRPVFGLQSDWSGHTRTFSHEWAGNLIALTVLTCLLAIPTYGDVRHDHVSEIYELTSRLLLVTLLLSSSTCHAARLGTIGKVPLALMS